MSNALVRRAAFSLALVVTSTFVGVLLAEAALRVIGFSSPVVSTPDLATGAFHRPNLQFTQNTEGTSDVRINSAGLRDREHTASKAASTFRIALLGDSYAEALQVNQDKTFWAILEKQLNACRPFGTDNVELINFGMSGFGTAQALQALRTRVWQYDPDLVLLAFVTGNDVRNNSPTLEPDKFRPFFSLGNDGTLVEDFGYLSHPAFKASSSRLSLILREASDHSRLIQLVNRAKNALRSQRSANPNTETPTPAGSETGLDDGVYLDHPAKQWDEAWAITKALLIQMNAEVTSHNARFLVVTLSNGIQVQPNQDITAAYMRAYGISDIFGPDRRVKHFGDENHFEVLTLAPHLQQIAQSTQTYLHGFSNSQMGAGHWNEKGHHYAGYLTSKYLCRSTPNPSQERNK